MVCRKYLKVKVKHLIKSQQHKKGKSFRFYPKLKHPYRKYHCKNILINYPNERNYLAINFRGL